jgi:hypothetical protein
MNIRVDAANLIVLDVPSEAMTTAGANVACEAGSADMITDETVNEIYSAMRAVCRAEQEEELNKTMTPQLRAWLAKSTVTSFNNEKFIVTGNMLRIEDLEGRVIEERLLTGREGQLLGTMIFLQNQREEESRPEQESSERQLTSDDILARGKELVKDAESIDVVVSVFQHPTIELHPMGHHITSVSVRPGRNSANRIDKNNEV